MKIEYDTPFEVNAKQYKALMTRFKGIVAGRSEYGKFYIKVWFPSYGKMILKTLEDNK